MTTDEQCILWEADVGLKLKYECHDAGIQSIRQRVCSSAHVVMHALQSTW